jgi:hypothetical protein
MRRSFSEFVKEIGPVRSHGTLHTGLRPVTGKTADGVRNIPKILFPACPGPIPGQALDWETEIRRMINDNDDKIDMPETGGVPLNV